MVAVPHAPRQPTDTDRVIGQRIATLRKARGLSRAALGRAIGVTFQQIQKYETGQNRVGAGRLATLARLLDVTVATFYEEEGAQGESRAAIFEDLNRPGAVDLLRAYAALADDDLRREVLALVRAAVRLGAAKPAEG